MTAFRKGSRTDRPWWRELAFAFSFLGVFAILQLGYAAARDTVVERAVIDVATILPAATLINLIAPDERVRPAGHRLISENVRLSVLNGCEGTETLFLLVAAIIAFAAPWRHKLLGVLIGGLLVCGLNQMRIVGLYFALRHDKALFALVHGYIGPTLIIIICVLFFLWWAGHGPHQDDVPAPAS